MDDRDGLIRVMPETLANKIAAGEVVQRPASALKELMENALDAGADEVEVHLKQAGRDLIQVVDDGCGMSRDDARRCFLRHATSKVQSADDLLRIRTLGFRGEALASIAAVARVELKTRRQEDAAGILVRVDGGEEVDVRPCAVPAGTNVAVRNLFYNVPARRNFLKTPATELKHCVETFQQLALANSRTGFTLTHNGNEMYRLSGHHDVPSFEALRIRIVELFGDDYVDHLVPVSESVSYLDVHGYVAQPEFTRRSRGEQFLFVNGRYVHSRYLSHAVKVAYGDLLADGAFPFFALTLDLDPARVDVNVHPTKAEVKFEDEQGVYSALRTVVKRSLGASDLTPLFERKGEPAGDDEADAGEDGGAEVPTFKGHGLTLTSGDENERRAAPPSFGNGRATGGTSPSERARPRPRRAPGDLSKELYDLPEDASLESDADRRGDTGPERQRALIWQLEGRYLVVQGDAGLTFIDQQAAHQRILYEQALTRLEQESGDSQQLLFPETVELNPAHFALLEELLPQLRALGFDVDLFSGRSVIVRGVPADVRSGTEASMLEEVLQQYQDQNEKVHVKSRENLAKSMALRGAIRHGERLSEEERHALIQRLLACEMPYASPTGRATLVKMPVEELDERFGG